MGMSTNVLMQKLFSCGYNSTVIYLLSHHVYASIIYLGSDCVMQCLCCLTIIGCGESYVSE